MRLDQNEAVILNRSFKIKYGSGPKRGIYIVNQSGVKKGTFNEIEDDIVKVLNNNKVVLELRFNDYKAYCGYVDGVMKISTLSSIVQENKHISKDTEDYVRSRTDTCVVSKVIYLG